MGDNRPASSELKYKLIQAIGKRGLSCVQETAKKFTDKRIPGTDKLTTGMLNEEEARLTLIALGIDPDQEEEAKTA